ncbi:AAA family ATPase [Geofilum rubicundum]|uniref:Ribosylnicotinamide kinase n=1 Tax=Geofilum rubicundum JCM 15548 TaxID=1236989 RepID=A0A0E9LQL4_9BACT|nr:ATP-binding protein [Geofilum rubicundum]GAO27588.1 ribosylnicotinamide kinase [Geofilum rubicundum JCM 15548]
MKWIVITGAESSGKSTLTGQLSKVFAGMGVFEYARDYVERLKRPYQQKDVETVAKRQLYFACKIRKDHANSDIFVFFDTFLIVTKIWLEEVYHNSPIWLNQAIIDNKPDLVLLCEPDLEWQADGVRENSDKRDYLFHRYRKELEYYQIPYSIVNGKGDKRLQLAVQSIHNKF